MSARVPCRECGQPMSIVKGRATEARLSRFGVLRDKRCRGCGHVTTTVELPVGDIPRLLQTYLAADRNN